MMTTFRALVCLGLLSLMAASHAHTAQNWGTQSKADHADACVLALQHTACKSGFAVKDHKLPYRLQPADRRNPDCLLAFCKAPRFALLDTAGSNNQDATASTAQLQDDADTWTSDRTGYYLLGAIPLIVGAGSLLGIDHRLNYDNSGIWKRSNQLDLEYGVVLTELGGGLWFGGENRIGRTFWQSIDATAFSALTVQALKYTFSRARPSQSSSPNHWFQGGCCQSFPSGEVALQASFVTPLILEYHRDNPWIWGLEALPLYDAVARMKTQGHWQTDVLSGWALGTAFGIFAHNRNLPFFLSIMPQGVMLGWHTSF